MKKIVSILAATSLAAFICGCSSPKQDMSSNYNELAIPKEKYLVGGGLLVKYIAPQDGTLHWVQTSTVDGSCRILLTMTMAKGDVFSKNVSDYKDSLGITDMSNLRMKLYFVPTPKDQAEPEQPEQKTDAEQKATTDSTPTEQN